MGLGRVKTWQMHRRIAALCEVAMDGRFSGGDDFSTVGAGNAASSRLGRPCNGRRPHIGGDYALIDAMSGWTPMMFMTRVRLAAGQ